MPKPRAKPDIVKRDRLYTLMEAVYEMPGMNLRKMCLDARIPDQAGYQAIRRWFYQRKNERKPDDEYHQPLPIDLRWQLFEYFRQKHRAEVISPYAEGSDLV